MIPSRPMAMELNPPYCIIHAWSTQLTVGNELWTFEVSVKGDLDCHLTVQRYQPESARGPWENFWVWPSLTVLAENARDAMTEVGVPSAVIDSIYLALPSFAADFELKYMTDEWDHVEEDLIMLPYEDDEESWR
jgi:hypothetical protein